MPNSNLIASEDDFLSLVDQYFPRHTGHELLGRGDDCAELAMPLEVCVSSDLFLEDVHFRTSYFNYFEIGYKALAVNLSDLASAGAKPLGFNMNLILPKQTLKKEVDDLLRGMATLANKYKLPLTGGDLSSGNTLGICITIWGEKTGSRFLRRAECKAGDYIFLLSNKPFSLGLARAGLTALEKLGREQAIRHFPLSCTAHLTPTPLLELGAALAKLAPQASLLDLSDGLAKDLPRLLGWSKNIQNLGAELSLEQSELNPELHTFCQEFKLNLLEEAVRGGEDYLLLGSIENAEILEQIQEECNAQALIIGQVVSKKEITLNKKPLTINGFDHFNG